MSDVIQTLFGKYRLLSLLGQGGMGHVFSAFDTATERIVALKVLPPNLAEDEQFKERFRREAHAAAGLTEPHVIPIHGFGEIDGRLYIDMRLIDGRDLKSVLKAGALEPDRAVAIIEQVAAALSAAHRVGLVHRDVKPSNIIVAENDFAYLIDFGIARGIDETGLTGTGLAVGTLAYMAPERFETGQADHRSDIYSLACVLHESLTGQPPFAETDPEQQISAHLTKPPPRPSALRPDLPSEFDAVVAKGMAKNPDERYQTATDLARAAHHAARAGASTSPAYGMPQPMQLDVGTAPSGIPPPASPGRPQPTPDWASRETVHRPTPVPPRPPTAPTAPGGPMPPSGQMPPRARRWWRGSAGIALAAALAVGAIITVVTVVVVRGNDSGTEPVPPLPSAAQPTPPTTVATTPAGPDIDTLPLNAADVSAAIGISGMQLDGSRWDQPYAGEAPATAPPECTELRWAGIFNETDLNRSGWITVRGEQYKGPESDGVPRAYEAVVELPTLQLAVNLRDRITAAWQQCNGKTYTDGDVAWEASVTSRSDRTIAVSVQKSVPDWKCQSVITTAQNYVVVARACKLGAPAAETIVDQLIARVYRR